MYLIWAMAGIILLMWDFKKTNTLKLTFATSSLFCAITAYKIPNNYIFQPVAFVLFSIIFYILIKTILEKEKRDIGKFKNISSLKDKTAIVNKDIGKTFSIDGLGLIEYNNELYSAKSIDDKEIKAGKMVEIVSVENKILNVKVKNNGN